MPKKKDPPESPKDQFRRFLEVAEEKGVDEKEAEKNFKKIAAPCGKKAGGGNVR